MVEKDFEDLWYYVVAEPTDYHVDFKIYVIEGRKEDGTPLFHEKGKRSSPAPVDKLVDADVYAHGGVKWDGCSNWSIDELDRCMLHFCSKQQAQDLGLILGECYNMARTLCPKWDGD